MCAVQIIRSDTDGFSRYTEQAQMEESGARLEPTVLYVVAKALKGSGLVLGWISEMHQEIRFVL